MYDLYILRIFKWKVAVSSVLVWNRLKQCFKHMFGRINELLIILIFEYLIVLIFMKKIGFRETSPDNRGSTVQWNNTHASVVSLSIFWRMKQGVDCTQIKLQVWLSLSVRQCQNPCSWPPPVFQDLSQCLD